MNESLDPILQQEEQRKLRVQLMWRLAIAAALVCGVLGALAWLDQEKDQKPQVTVSTPKEVRIAPATASTVTPEPITASQTEASTPASTPQIASVVASMPAAIAAPASAPQTIPTPLRASTATLQTPQLVVKPVEIAPNQQQTAIQPAAKPATAAIATPAKPAAAIAPAVPTHPVAPIKPTAPPKLAEINKPTPPAQYEPPPPATEKPVRQAAAAPATRYPAPVATPNGYTVQTGVFLHSANAENMLKQVQNAGIPAYLETRVQIGPFSNRIEAEIAVQKLRKLGIEPVVKID